MYTICNEVDLSHHDVSICLARFFATHYGGVIPDQEGTSLVRSTSPNTPGGTIRDQPAPPRYGTSVRHWILNSYAMKFCVDFETRRRHLGSGASAKPSD